MLWIRGEGTAVHLEGLKIEGRGGEYNTAINCGAGASFVAVRCQLVGNGADFSDEGTKGKLRECTLEGSNGRGFNVYAGASVTVDGGVVRGCADHGVNISRTSRCTTTLVVRSPARAPSRAPAPLLSSGIFRPSLFFRLLLHNIG